MSTTQVNDDEISLVDIIKVLWKFKYLLIIIPLVFSGGGIYYALKQPNMYSAFGTIVLKKQDQKSSSILNKIGAIGGGMASSLIGGALGGDDDLNKYKAYLSDISFNKMIIEKYSLMPYIFFKQWDKEKKQWILKDSTAEVPHVHKGVSVIREGIVSINVDDKIGTLKISTMIQDSILSRDLVKYYLNELDTLVRTKYKEEVRKNREYLEDQYARSADPWVKEKIQELIVSELEKDMFAHSSAFEIINEPVIPYEKSKPKRSLIVVVAGLLGVFFTLILIFILENYKKVKVALNDS